MLKDLPPNTRVTLLLIPAGYAAGALYACRPWLALLVAGMVTLVAVLPLLRKEPAPAPDLAE